MMLSMPYIDGLVQERRNFTALALELRLSCTKPSIWHQKHWLSLPQVIAWRLYGAKPFPGSMMTY